MKSLSPKTSIYSQTYGKLYAFVPTTYILPKEREQFNLHFKQNASRDKNLWIYKPSASARGRGIYVFDDVEAFWKEAAMPCIVQSYLHRPLTIEGYKFDLRLYCLVTSFWPLKCYLHCKGCYHGSVQELWPLSSGLTRFSAHKYDMSSLDNRFSHLTNFSINKSAPKRWPCSLIFLFHTVFILSSSTPLQNDFRQLSPADERILGQGCKWTLVCSKTDVRYSCSWWTQDEMWDELRSRQYNVKRIWKDIKRLVLLTLMPLVPTPFSRATRCPIPGTT